MTAFSFKTPFASEGDRLRAGRFGIVLFLLSLAVLFLATMLALIIVRIELGRKDLWPSGLPAPPWGLAVSTLVLAISSVTMHLGAIRTTFGLGLLFLAVQAVCWLVWLGVVREHWTDSDQWRLALTGFYVMTGLHAVHVLGGLIALGLLIVRPGAIRPAFCAIYWHFLGAVWLVVYALLLVWR